MKYVESVARRELNLIKENEVIYRFSKEPVRENHKNSFN
jgi:cell division protein FtsB